MTSRSPWAWVYWWPVRRSEQMLFAEALSQALAAGLDVSGAVAAASLAIPSRRFRAALHEMTASCRRGYTLAASLARTGVAVSDELLAALEIGEERGELPEMLASFARQCDPWPGARVAAAVGRPPEVARFAAALARLLENRRMTVGVIEDAARLAARERSRFFQVVGRVTEAMRGGDPFPSALSRESRTFDPLFCTLVGVPDQRDRLRAVLAKLGEAGP